jgi:hypothetical protein
MFIFFVLTAYTQQNLHPLETLTENQGKKNDSELWNDNHYIFKVYNSKEKAKGEIEQHYMGNEIAEKWTIFNELYLHKGDITIGFGTSYIETAKPSVYNAVCRMNSYYKKAINKELIQFEDAKQQFSWILDCALAALQYDDTEKFERTLSKMKDPQQIIQLFNSVKIETF